MFRQMRRFKQQLTQEECIRILTEEPRGVLSLMGDDGYPYGIPMDQWYCPEDGCLYFHSGPTGHKVDALRACPKASFCVMDEGHRKDGDWALHIRSVIVFGKMEFVQDHAAAIELTRQLSNKYTADAAYIQEEIDKYGHEVLVFKLIPEHITGKITKES